MKSYCKTKFRWLWLRFGWCRSDGWFLHLLDFLQVCFKSSRTSPSSHFLVAPSVCNFCRPIVYPSNMLCKIFMTFGRIERSWDIALNVTVRLVSSFCGSKVYKTYPLPDQIFFSSVNRTQLSPIDMNTAFGLWLKGHRCQRSLSKICSNQCGHPNLCGIATSQITSIFAEKNITM